MRIKKLTLENFRNYENETFEFGDGLNVLSGRNAQGKTNCAEAVFYLCTGTPLRIRHEKQLVKFGAERARVTAETQTRFGLVTLGAEISENGHAFFVNGNKTAKFVDFLGNMNSVFFSPGELRLVQDGPEERRRFLDLSISQTSRPYCTALVRYGKLLEQRNNLLKTRNVDTVFETLPVWDEQLASYAARIVKARREFLRALSPVASEIHSLLTDGTETLALGADYNDAGSEEEIAKRLLSSLESSYERDLRLGYTTVGPHRDDVKIAIDGVDARGYASQGQTRTAALALKLGEVEIFKSLTGEAPVLILDDVLSELDLMRRKKLVERTRGLQCVLTCTHAERVLFGRECTKIKIHGGKIIR